MAKPKKGLKEPAGAKLSKFRVGYSLKWNFNGIMEVEAEDADDAERKARDILDNKGDGGEFDDVSKFKVEYDDASVLDTEEVREYDEECRHARGIASLSEEELNGEAAAHAVASAVVCCRAHPVTLEGDGLVCFEYDNSFGPTATVDYVLERMNMRDWRMACDEFCKIMLRKGGFDPEDYDWPTPLPKVMKVPEDEGTDVISRVAVTFTADKKTYEAFLRVVDGEDAPATGEEICTNCDHVIRYVCEDGRRVVTCPECGSVNPLCNECGPGMKKCSECAVSAMCEKLNEMRAGTPPEQEVRE